MLSRLQALFGPSPSDAAAASSVSPNTAFPDGQPASALPAGQNMVKERESIKVLIVTWNMGDALVSRMWTANSIAGKLMASPRET